MAEEISIEVAEQILKGGHTDSPKFYGGDQSIVAAVNSAYARAHPGDLDLSADANFEANIAKQGEPPPDLGKVEPSQSAPAEAENFAPTPEQLAVDQLTEHELRHEWGVDYAANVEIIEKTALNLFGGDRDKLIDFMVRNEIDVDLKKRVAAAKFLLDLAKK